MTEDHPHYFERHIFCCTNERADGHPRGCCKARGGEELRNYMKARSKELGLTGRVRVNNAGCLDRCELGPVLVVYPEGVWYRPETQEDIEAILQDHIIEGNRVDRLVLHPDHKDPSDLEGRDN